MRIETHTEVTGIEPGGVVAAGALIETGCVICAAGTGSRALGELAGVELAVRPERRRIAYTGPLPIEGELPMTIDFASGFYFHREGPGLLFGTSDVCDTQDEWLERAVPVLRRRAPLLLDAPIAGGWWGDYEMTPDHNALIGEARDGPGPLPVRHRLLRARLPAGARPSARSCATSTWAASRSWTCQRSPRGDPSGASGTSSS